MGASPTSNAFQGEALSPRALAFPFLRGKAKSRLLHIESALMERIKSNNYAQGVDFNGSVRAFYSHPISGIIQEIAPKIIRLELMQAVVVDMYGWALVYGSHSALEHVALFTWGNSTCPAIVFRVIRGAVEGFVLIHLTPVHPDRALDHILAELKRQEWILTHGWVFHLSQRQIRETVQKVVESLHSLSPLIRFVQTRRTDKKGDSVLVTLQEVLVTIHGKDKSHILRRRIYQTSFARRSLVAFFRRNA